jgi:hypothetical protein
MNRSGDGWSNALIEASSRRSKRQSTGFEVHGSGEEAKADVRDNIDRSCFCTAKS